MIHVENFSNGALNPVLAYVMSCVGCFVGLRCTTRARAYQGAARARWLTLAALAIATTGIWVMHFIAMLGFAIPGQSIRYNVPLTIASMLIAVVVVGIGTFIVGYSRGGPWPLLAGGSIIGVGVASMHYLGMAAIRVPDRVTYNPTLVAASVVIAIIAGIAALWAALRLDTLLSTLVASLIMGVAVSGMHYTGMAALHVYATPGAAVNLAERQRRRVPAAAHPEPVHHRLHLLGRHRAVADGERDPGRGRADEADRADRPIRPGPIPASTVPGCTAPASTVPASTVPGCTVPGCVGRAGTVPGRGSVPPA